MNRLEEIDDEIAKLRAEQDRLREEEGAARRKQLQAAHGVRVVCPDCVGSGDTAPADIQDGPGRCDRCDGVGYLWAIRFTGRNAVLAQRELLEALETISEIE